MSDQGTYTGHVQNGSSRSSTGRVGTSTSGSRNGEGDVIRELGQLPSVTAEVVESAVLLAKAEARLALFEAKGLAQKAIVGLIWVVLAGFLLHAAVLLLVLGLLLSLELTTATRWVLITVPSIVALGAVWFAWRSVREVKKHE